MSISAMRFTDAGLALRNRNSVGERLNITRLAMGTGTLEDATMIPSLPALIHEVISIPINLRYVQEHQVTVSGQLNVAALTASFRWRELGVFAAGEDGEEVLYGYLYLGEDGDIVRPDGKLLERTITVIVAVGDATNVTVKIDPSTARAIYLHIIRTRVRDPDKPSYGLWGAEEDSGQTALRVSPYSGSAEVAAKVSGVMYDADNMSAHGETAPDGTLIIKKLEE